MLYNYITFAIFSMMKKIIAYKRYFSDFILTLSREECGKIKRALDLFKVEE